MKMVGRVGLIWTTAGGGFDLRSGAGVCAAAATAPKAESAKRRMRFIGKRSGSVGTGKAERRSAGAPLLLPASVRVARHQRRFIQLESQIIALIQITFPRASVA